jgi:elongation factor Ts
MSMAITAEQVKQLRDATGAGVMDCRKALDEAGGDFEKAQEILKEKSLAMAAKRAEREASEGVIELYSHGNGRVGVMVEVNSETDFVARSEGFRSFAHEIALQIAATAPRYVSESDIPEAVLEEERQMARKRALEEGKPEHIVERIVEGRLSKFVDEVCLLRQPYIRDENVTVQDILTQTIQTTHENIVIRRFERWEVGEDLDSGSALDSASATD